MPRFPAVAMIVPKLAMSSMLLLAAGCGDSGEARTPGGGANGGRGGGRGQAESRATAVEIAVAELGRIARTTTLAGTLEPIRSVGVNAQLAGPLQRVHVLEGTRVGAGTTLATIAVPELQAQIRSAEAALGFARSTAERAEALFAQRIVTAAEIERDRAALAAAQATLEALRARATFATVRAPMAGVVTERLVETGDIVSPNQRLFTIADVSTLVTRVQVSELEVGALAAGETVQLTADALPGDRFTGRIRRVFPAADSATRMIPVEVALAGTGGGRLRPGYTVRATFRLGARDDAILIPARAVQGSAGNQTVFRVERGAPVRQPVRLGEEVEGRVEVLEGVSAGDTVIVAGASEVREGGAIRIVEPLAPEESGAPGRRRAASSGDTLTDTLAASRRERR